MPRVAVWFAVVLIAVAAVSVSAASLERRKHHKVAASHRRVRTATVQHAAVHHGSVARQRASTFLRAAVRAGARVSTALKCEKTQFGGKEHTFEFPVVLPEDKVAKLSQSEKFLKYNSGVLEQAEKKDKKGHIEIEKYTQPYLEGQWAIPSKSDAEKWYKEDPNFMAKPYQKTDAGKALVPVVDQMIKWADKHAMPLFDMILKVFSRLENKEGRTVRPVVAPVKSVHSSIPKIGKDYGGNPRLLIDAVRGSLVYQEMAHLLTSVCRFAKWVSDTGHPSIDGRKCSIINSKNRWSGDEVPPAGYRDIMITLGCNIGDDNRLYLMEIQFHYCAFMMVKQGDIKTINHYLTTNYEMNGHERYEKTRKVVEPKKGDSKLVWDAYNEKIKPDVDAQKEMYEMAASPAGENCPIDDAPKWEARDFELDEQETEEIVKNAQKPDQPNWQLVGFKGDWDANELNLDKNKIEEFKKLREEREKSRAARLAQYKKEHNMK